jgi:hypothetical protein
MRRRVSGSAAARACPQPRVQEEANGLRNPRVAGHPATHRPFVHTQAPGRLHLAQAQAAEDIAELLRRHGHNAVGNVPVARLQGKLPQPTWGRALSNRAICPRLLARCLLISQTRQHGTSAGRSDYWRSWKMTCAPRPRASWGATSAWGWLWRHGAGYDSQRPRSGRRSVRRVASFEDSCPSAGSSSGWLSWRASARRACSDSCRGSCVASCAWSSRCERSSSPPDGTRGVGGSGREPVWSCWSGRL